MYDFKVHSKLSIAWNGGIAKEKVIDVILSLLVKDATMA
jgi:hypothetical protein